MTRARTDEIAYRHRLGRQMAHVRKESGLSTFELARMIERSVRLIQLWESGLRWPPSDVLYRISVAVGLPMDHLIP